MSDEAYDLALHLPPADTERLARSLVVSGITKVVTNGKKQHGHYRLMAGQMLLSDGVCVLESMQKDTLKWTLGPEATFAMVIQYCVSDKHWKVLRVDFFYPGRLRETRFFSELSALGFRPRKIDAVRMAP